MQELRPLIGDSHDARVAELVDAHDSGSCPSNGVQVQLLPKAPLNGGFRSSVSSQNLISITPTVFIEMALRCGGLSGAGVYTGDGNW